MSYNTVYVQTAPFKAELLIRIRNFFLDLDPKLFFSDLDPARMKQQINAGI